MLLRKLWLPALPTSSAFSCCHSQQPLINHRRKLRFIQCTAPSHRTHPFPTLVDKTAEVGQCLVRLHSRPAHHPCRTAGTEFALTGAHAHPCASAQVEQVVDVQFLDGIFHFADTHFLTFADQRAVFLTYVL